MLVREGNKICVVHKDRKYEILKGLIGDANVTAEDYEEFIKMLLGPSGFDVSKDDTFGVYITKFSETSKSRRIRLNIFKKSDLEKNFKGGFNGIVPQYDVALGGKLASGKIEFSITTDNVTFERESNSSGGDSEYTVIYHPSKARGKEIFRDGINFFNIKKTVHNICEQVRKSLKVSNLAEELVIGEKELKRVIKKCTGDYSEIKFGDDR
jgi:hypothetical protein